MGSSTAGGAYVPAMSDETVIVRGTGTIFLGGPPLVKAATGEEVRPRTSAEAIVHARVCRAWPTISPSRRRARHRPRPPDRREPEPAPARGAVGTTRARGARRRAGRYDEDRAPVRRDPDRPASAARDPRRHRPPARRQPLPRVQAAVRRDARVRASATSTAGPSVSSRNDGILFSQSALKGAHFIELAAQRRIPLVFLQNITGFMVGREYESGGIAKDGAKMVMAVACAEVPKFTVIVGGSFGAGNYAMAGRAYQPRFLWTWPNARISVMGGRQAARVLSTVRGDVAVRRGTRRLRGADPRVLRARGLAVFRHRPTLGRRRHRSARHPPRPCDGARRRAPRTDPGDALRRVQDVSTSTDASSRSRPVASTPTSTPTTTC